MPWIAITKADLYATRVAALVDAVDSVSLANNGQAVRTTEIIADVTNEIRRKCGRANALDADVSKIPAGLKSLALDLIGCRIKLALEMALSSDEKDLLAARERDLNRIADGKDLVDLPDNPLPSSVTMQSNGSAQIVNQTPRQATRTQTSGLI